MFLFGKVTTPRLQVKRRFVMPAKAGIHLRLYCKAKEILDSGLRRNDERKVGFQSTNSDTLVLKPRGIQFQ
jgi:hypothetical protein